MANKGSFLEKDQFLGVDDYLVSPNRFFYAIMQSDGNFCVYRGSGPSDNQGVLWGALKAIEPEGQYFAIMQSDGNLCVYRGSGPSDNRGVLWGALSASQPGGQYYTVMQDDGNLCIYHGTPAHSGAGVWCTMVFDPVVSVEISDIQYDLQAAQILNSGEVGLYQQIVHNDTTEKQSSTINGSSSVTETYGWSNAIGTKIGISAKFTAKIPFVAQGEVTASAEVSDTFTWSGSTSKTKAWGFSTPVVVPPHSTIVVHVTVTVSSIVVPYTLKGTFTLRSGARISGSVTDKFYGINSHDMQVKFLQQDPVTLQIQQTTQELSATTIEVTEEEGVLVS